MPDVATPPWPLRPDVYLIARQDHLTEKVAHLQSAIVDEADGRRRARIRRELDKAELELGIVRLQAEQVADAESAMWAELWTTPQAAIWAENPATVRELALYVRWMTRAEQGDNKASSEARQLSNVLGVNPAALLRLRAEIERADAAEDRGRRRRNRATSPDRNASGPPTDPRGGLFAV